VIHRVVTLGGPPGSGKSTAGRLVAAELGLELRSAGELFRAEAVRRGMSLPEFGRFAEAHSEVDRELDRRMQALAAPGRILEGRIQGALCQRAGTPVYRVAVDASVTERARRLAGRDHQTADEALRALRTREESERTRYLRFYGIDLAAERADLLVDSTDLNPASVARAIIAFLSDAEAKA
jgi:CMP/dCMP kinase